MTGTTKICSTCGEAIPQGALYCLTCGSTSPTEIDATIAEGMSPLPPPASPMRSSMDSEYLRARMAELQSALGEGFEVRGLIGRGGFGEVWKVFDRQLGRDVAVKLLRPEISANPDFRARFRREARAIARLRHPGIVPIYHVGDSGGLVWFIMPLVEGTTLKQALATPGGLSADEAVRILIEAASALRDAHTHGIVHRDLKPENIMLEGPQRRALLMDFGVAKFEEPAGGGGEGLTEADTVIGSPEYMSPEQATGRELDARSDIYSLGVVGYRMLAGKLPFDAETPREVLAHHVLTAPTPLLPRAGLPAPLLDAVMRCLAKAPENRWQSAEALGAALAVAAPRASQMAAEVAAEVTPQAPLPRRIIFARRRAAIVVGLGLLLGLGAVTPWPIVRWRKSRKALATAAAVAAQYRQASDSVRALGDAFVRGGLTAAQLADARGEVTEMTQVTVATQYGDELRGAARWPAAAQRAVRAASAAMASAGVTVTSYAMRPNDVAGCRLNALTDTVTLEDRATGDNCWWSADGVKAMAGPVEYGVRFRVPRPLGADAGLGMAWCRADGECRIAWLWPSAGMVWGAHRPHRGLQALQTGRPTPLNPGVHELRVRYQDGVLRCWLDGGVILERRSPADQAWLEQPASVNLVVQNAAIELDGPDPFVGVGLRR